MGRLAVQTILFLFVLASTPARAHETDEDYGYRDTVDLPVELPAFRDHDALRSIEPGRRLHKHQLALKTLGIPLEPKPDFTKFPRPYETSMEAFLETSRFVDPEGALKRYLDLQPRGIDLYRDFFNHLLSSEFFEYSVETLESGPSRDSNALMERLKTIAKRAQVPNIPAPLYGVKIAIDPGHMGDELWDTNTGKYVAIRNKKKQLLGRVSEGQLTLWTAFLAANALRKLGAEVRLTRDILGPVSQVDYRSYDFSQYRNHYFYNSLDGWMRHHFHLGDSAFIKTIKSLDEVKKMFPETTSDLQKLRTELFITAEDLEARAQMISNFEPDLTIDIHYDATRTTQLQSKTNDVEGYVPGQFSLTETGSRSIRANALQHALEARRWNESVSFTGTLTSALSKSLGLPLQTIPAMSFNGTTIAAVKVRDGVYARNLYLTRRSFKGLIAYLECFHYDHTSEFWNLTKNDKVGTYNGLTFEYPNRLDQVAEGIRNGVLQYFQNLSENPGILQLETEQLDHPPHHIINSPFEIKTDFFNTPPWRSRQPSGNS